MTRITRKAGRISEARELRIQAGIAADPDNPEWPAADFKRAKPLAQAFPALAKSHRGADGRRSRPRSPSRYA